MVATVVMHPMDPIVIGLSVTPACEPMHLVARVALRRPLVQSHGRPSRPQPPNAETPNITVQYACSNSQSRHLCSDIPEAASSSLRAFSGSNQTAQFGSPTRLVSNKFLTPARGLSEQVILRFSDIISDPELPGRLWKRRAFGTH